MKDSIHDLVIEAIIPSKFYQWGVVVVTKDNQEIRYRRDYVVSQLGKKTYSELLIPCEI